jgi:hypothetical protein
MGDVYDRYNKFLASYGAGQDGAGRTVYSGPGSMYMGPGEFARTQQVHAGLHADAHAQQAEDSQRERESEKAWARGRQLFQENLASQEQARRGRETDQQAEAAKGTIAAIRGLGGGVGGGLSTNLHDRDGSRIGGSWLRKSLLG